MVIIKITPSCPEPDAFLIAVPSMAALYATLRGLPFGRIDVHGVFAVPPADIKYHLPEDEAKLVAHLLAESDKGSEPAAYSVAGAYGRRYLAPEEARRDWVEGLDFRIVRGPDAGRYCSIRDSEAIRESGFQAVAIRLEVPPFTSLVDLKTGAALVSLEQPK